MGNTDPGNTTREFRWGASLGSSDREHNQGVPMGNSIRKSDGEPRTSDGEHRWGTPSIIRGNSGSIYTTDSASYRSASLSYYDHWQYSIISLSLHPALLPYCLIALLLAPDLL